MFIGAVLGCRQNFDRFRPLWGLLCGVRYKRPIVEVSVPNELVVPMVIDGSAATAMHYGR